MLAPGVRGRAVAGACRVPGILLKPEMLTFHRNTFVTLKTFPLVLVPHKQREPFRSIAHLIASQPQGPAPKGRLRGQPLQENSLGSSLRVVFWPVVGPDDMSQKVSLHGGWEVDPKATLDTTRF